MQLVVGTGELNLPLEAYVARYPFIQVCISTAAYILFFGLGPFFKNS